MHSIESTNNTWFYESGVQMVGRYAQWVATNSETFKHVQLSCPKRFMLFRDLVAGSMVYRTVPVFDKATPIIDYFGGCGSHILRSFRDAAFNRLGFGPQLPAAYHSPMKVLFHDKLTDDKRRIVNIPELITYLRARFPGVVFDSKVISILSPRQQLTELGSTSIFITPHGSSSYRSIFLPDGSQVITIGPDEVGGESFGAWSEYSQCWRDITYYKHHCYHSDQPGETETTRKIWTPPDVDVDYFYWWRSDKRLIPEKLGNMVQVAIDSIIASVTQSLPDGSFVSFNNTLKTCYLNGLPDH